MIFQIENVFYKHDLLPPKTQSISGALSASITWEIMWEMFVFCTQRCNKSSCNGCTDSLEKCEEHDPHKTHFVLSFYTWAWTCSAYVGAAITFFFSELGPTCSVFGFPNKLSSFNDDNIFILVLAISLKYHCYYNCNKSPKSSRNYRVTGT